MRCNEAGRRLIERFEGLRLTAYQDLRGVWTIGYGHTGPEVAEGLTWTEEQADAALAHDLAGAEAAVNAALASAIAAGRLSDNAFSACVCLAYNIGAEAFAGSTLVRLVNEGDVDAIDREFVKWDHAGGVAVPGLLNRRRAEAQLFMTA